jgi:hypothetical protein
MATYPNVTSPEPFRPPEQSSVASTGAQPLIAGDWDLQLEEGEQVQYGCSFLVNQVVNYYTACVMLALFFPPFTLFAAIALLLLPCVRGVGRRMLNSRRCVVTTRSLYYYTESPCCCCCLWGQEQKFIPLDKIQDITIQQNWLQKKFGICNVVIETAGQAGPEVRPFHVAGMGEPMQFRQALLRARLGVAPTPAAEAPASDAMLRLLEEIATNTRRA